MAKTNLDEVSWGEKIGNDLLHALSCAYGAGYDYGRDEILYEHGKKVFQLDDFGNVIQTHPSVAQAAKNMGGSASNIRSVIYGRQHSAYGYGWRYANLSDYEEIKGSGEGSDPDE